MNGFVRFAFDMQKLSYFVKLKYVRICFQTIILHRNISLKVSHISCSFNQNPTKVI